MTTKLTAKTLILLFSLVSIMVLSNCNKEESKLNIVLYNKSLDTIKLYVQGMWHLKKVIGGICTTCGSPVKDNPYMRITNDHILLGNDNGVTVDTIIVWKRDKDIFNDSTYLLSIKAYKFYSFPIYKIVDRIENSQLILIDNAYDPYYYYYAK